MRKAGLEKRFLTIDDNGEARVFCYAEKGSRVPEQPSIIFIHGFSSDKHAWSHVIKVSQYMYTIIQKTLILVYLLEYSEWFSLHRH